MVNGKTGISNIEELKRMLNEDTDKGNYTKTTGWLVDKKFADLLGDRIKEGSYLEWDPQKRELKVVEWHKAD